MSISTPSEASGNTFLTTEIICPSIILTSLALIDNPAKGAKMSEQEYGDKQKALIAEIEQTFQEEKIVVHVLKSLLSHIGSSPKDDIPGAFESWIREFNSPLKVNKVISLPH